LLDCTCILILRSKYVYLYCMISKYVYLYCMISKYVYLYCVRGKYVYLYLNVEIDLLDCER